MIPALTDADRERALRRARRRGYVACLAVTAAFVIVACPTVRPAPRSHVRLIVRGAAESDQQLAACRVWTDYLGYTCGFDDVDLDECDRGWRKRREICQLTLGLVYDPAQTVTAQSNRDQRAAWFRGDLASAAVYTQRLAIEHELGHLILDTAEHTATGIMAGASVALSADDRDLARRTAQ